MKILLTLLLIGLIGLSACNFEMGYNKHIRMNESCINKNMSYYDEQSQFVIGYTYYCKDNNNELHYFELQSK